MKAGELRKKIRNARIQWLYAVYNKARYGNLEYIRRSYCKATGHELDLAGPRRFTEKIQWIKLYHRDPLYVRCTDKYEVRQWLAEKGYGELLIGLAGVWNSPQEIDFETLPEKFVIKATHGSTWNLICRDKQALRPHWKLCCKLMREWLRQDYALIGRELHYSQIPARLVCEDLLENPGGGEISDYKIFCFDGHPRMIQVDYNRFSGHRRNYYDTDWNLMEMNVATMDNMLPPEPRPEQLERMLDIACDLSAGFAHVRVDLYNVDGKIYFGEMTFTDGNGHFRYRPDTADRMMGDWFTLPRSGG